MPLCFHTECDNPLFYVVASTSKAGGDKGKKVPPRSLNLAIIPGDTIHTIQLAMDGSEPSSRTSSPMIPPETCSSDPIPGKTPPPPDAAAPIDTVPYGTPAVPYNSPASDVSAEMTR